MKSNNDTVLKFIRLLKKYDYRGIKNINGIDYEKSTPLTNFTYFLGSGFSKSWDNNYPLSRDIFQIEKKELSQDLKVFSELIFPDDFTSLDMEKIKYLNYVIHMQLEYEYLRYRFIDKNSLIELNVSLITLVVNKFITNERNMYNIFIDKIDNIQLNNTQTTILNYFKNIEKFHTGEKSVFEGIRTNFITTNYDFIIEFILLSLFENNIEEYLVYVYRGFSPNNFKEYYSQNYIPSYPIFHNYFKLNGGFEIRCSQNDYSKDSKIMMNYYVKKGQLDFGYFNLILPSISQNYKNIYFNTIFPKVTRLLIESNVLIIVGYSFPSEDYLVKLLFRHFSEVSEDLFHKNIFYINKSIDNDVVKRIKSTIPTEYINSNKLHIYEGTFEAWCNEININLINNHLV